MHLVRDGQRVLKFEGELLAHSSSKSPGRNRWVEFDLYITKSGTYVLGRIGYSTLFHRVSCDVAKRNALSVEKDAPTDFIGLIGCELCDPSDDDTELCVERPRYWAQVSDSPEGVLDALYKYDGSGTRYMTFVAQRLIEQAGAIDSALDEVYRNEYID